MNNLKGEIQTPSLEKIEENLMTALSATRILKNEVTSDNQEQAMRFFFEATSTLTESLEGYSRPALLGMLDANLKTNMNTVYNHVLEGVINVDDYYKILGLFHVQQYSLAHLKRQYYGSPNNLTQEYVDLLFGFSQVAYDIAKFSRSHLPDTDETSIQELDDRKDTFNQKLNECSQYDIYKRHDVIVEKLKALLDYEKRYPLNRQEVNKQPEKSLGSYPKN